MSTLRNPNCTHYTPLCQEMSRPHRVGSIIVPDTTRTYETVAENNITLQLYNLQGYCNTWAMGRSMICYLTSILNI